MKKNNFVLSLFLFYFSLTSLFLSTLNKAEASVNEVTYEEVLSNLGFTPLNDQVVDFELPFLEFQNNGRTENAKLSSFKGNWIWLVFWATWCGPCAYELPILEKLSKEFTKEKFKIVGVSLDQGSGGSTKNQVERYLKLKGVTFPQFLDGDGKVSSIYKASAIPTLYAISPDFRIVGVFRGANNWDGDGIKNNIKTLVQIKNLTPSQKNGISASSTLSQLGEEGGNQVVNKMSEAESKMLKDLPPPEIILLKPSKTTYSPYEKAKVELLVRWKSDASNYLLKVPRLLISPEEGIKILETSSEVRQSGQGGASELVYIFNIQFLKEGHYDIGPAEVAYYLRNVAWAYITPNSVEEQQQKKLPDERKLLYTRSNKIEFKVESFFTKYKNFILGFFIILLVILVLFLLRKYFLKGERMTPSNIGMANSGITWNISILKKYESEYIELSKMKNSYSNKEYELNLVTFYYTLFSEFNIVSESSSFARMLKGLIEDFKRKERERIIYLKEQIKFGGHKLSQEERESYERSLERVFNEKNWEAE